MIARPDPQDFPVVSQIQLRKAIIGCLLTSCIPVPDISFMKTMEVRQAQMFKMKML
jgi:hypothetical protein